MGQLSAADLRALLDFTLEARSFTDLASYRAGVLPGLLRLVPADVAGYNEVDAERGTTVVISDPVDAFFDGVEERFASVVHQHPVVARAQAGDRAAYKISDFLTEREYHRLELYQDMYRHIDAEDQIAFALPGEHIVGLALNRGRRSFSERDREVLDSLRRLGLTARQAEVLRLVTAGEPDERIASELFITRLTVRKHLENIYAKLGVNSRTAAAARANAARF
jgi:DNA-binding CsgD family transcriptional regulator